MGALSLLGRLSSSNSTSAASQPAVTADESFVQEVVHWLVYRQTTRLAEDGQGSEVADGQPSNVHEASLGTRQSARVSYDAPHSGLQGTLDHQDVQSQQIAPSQNNPPGRDTPLFQVLGASIDDRTPHASPPAPLQVDSGELLWVGFSGRCNKYADTCYSWWAGSTLHVSISWKLPNAKSMSN